MGDNKLCLYTKEVFNFDNVKVKNFITELAENLSKSGFDVTVICRGEKVSNKNGIKIIPLDDAENILNGCNFNYFISDNEFGKIKYINSDFKLLLSGGDNVNDDGYFDAVTYYSEFQRDYLLKGYNYDKKNVLPFYVDVEYYKENLTSIVKKNKMVWDSPDVFSLDLLVYNVLPLIRQEIKDFVIEIVYFDGLECSKYENIDGVLIIDNNNFEEIALRKKESKIWIHVNTGVFTGENTLVDGLYKSAVENLVSNNVIIAPSFHGLSEILQDCSVFVGDNLFDEKTESLTTQKSLDELFVALSTKAIEVLSNKGVYSSVIENYNSKYEPNSIHQVISYITGLLNKDYSRFFCNDFILNKIKRRLVFHFWIPVIKTQFYHDINNIHLECLKRFIDRFNESVFVLACDDIKDDYIDFIKEKIYEMKPKGDLYIKVIENNVLLREAITFNDEIMHKLDKLDGVTFFAHNKGTSRYGSLYNKFIGGWFEPLLFWITSMYYVSLNDIIEVVRRLNKMKTYVLGPMLVYNSNESYDFYGIKWFYSGSFQWIQTQRLYGLLGGTKIDYDPSDAETFIPSKIPFNDLFISSMNGYYMFDFSLMCNDFLLNNDLFYEILKSSVPVEKFDEYMDFHYNLESIKNIKNKYRNVLN